MLYSFVNYNHFRLLLSEPVFLNVYGAQESIPTNEFRQPFLAFMQDEREGELEPNVRQLQKKRGSLPMYSPLNLNQVLSMLCNK